MKHIKKVIFIILLLIVSTYKVEAKDTSYSINKYSKEIFKYIEKSYDKNLKEDGYVLGGDFLKDEIEKEGNKYSDYQVMLVKYNNNGKILWKYSYGNTKEDYLDYLTYTYDEESNIDGYLIVTKKTYDVLSEHEDNNKTVLIKVDLEGKFVYEKEIEEGNIIKIIPTYEEDKVDGYISITNTSVIKYNKNYEVVLKKDYNESTLKDITIIKEENKIVGYAIIENNHLIKLDLNGNDTVLEDIAKYQTTNLSEADNGFILYGITSDVKLKKGNSSYYLINYNNNGEEEWETIGTTPATKEKETVLIPIKEENKIVKYFLLYKNEVDSSYEVTSINKEGIVEKKIKKINNSYYNFKNFTSDGKTIYFIGQITCPEDENCEYDNNSLYLVSDEDKVIEVQDNDSKSILIVVSVFIILTAALIIIRKRKTVTR